MANIILGKVNVLPRILTVTAFKAWQLISRQVFVTHADSRVDDLGTHLETKVYWA